MNQEYYGSDNAPFADLADTSSGIELTEQMVVEAARRIYDNQESASELDVQMYEAVLASFHNAIAEGLADAVSSGTGAVSDEFLEQLRSSNEVFSTFKVHRMQRDIASQLFTAEGKLKSRSRFVKDVLPVASHHVKAWLRTEYDTAVLRAHQAADWLQFERDKDIVPNLRWMPSTSITPGEDHRVFWNTVLPIEHRFWSVHRPGDRWNCKCRLEATDDAPTAVPSIEKNDKKNNPARGLENNPAKDGHIFSNKHSYFPSSCSTCPYGTKKGNLFALAAKRKGDCYHCKKVERSIRDAKKQRKLELFTVKSNKEDFRKAQKALRQHLGAKGKVVRDSKKLYTSHLYFGKDERNAIASHCYNGLELQVAENLHTIIPKLKNGKYIPLNLQRENIDNKFNDGILNFTAYEILYKYRTFVLKCAVKRNGVYVCEYPYSIKLKE